MRLFASRNIGHGIGLGVSSDAGRLSGSGEKTVVGKPGKSLAVAVVELTEHLIKLEQRVAAVGANTTKIRQRITELDDDLAHFRTARARMATSIPKLPPPAARAQAATELAKLDANIAGMEDLRSKLEALMSTSAAHHAEGLRRLAEFRAKRDAALARL